MKKHKIIYIIKNNEIIALICAKNALIRRKCFVVSTFFVTLCAIKVFYF